MPRRPLILCVDDRAENLLIRKLFLEQFGYEVIAVTEPQDCMRAVTREQPDLALIDYHLGGGVTGDQLASDIRCCRPRLPLIMLTGDPRVPESARGAVDAVIIKGANNPSDLLAAINKLLTPKLRPVPRAGTTKSRRRGP